MKRRLSVAIACVGDLDIVILGQSMVFSISTDCVVVDEPTTGLDPSSRRQVWEVIDNVKQNKSVVSGRVLCSVVTVSVSMATDLNHTCYGGGRSFMYQNRLLDELVVIVVLVIV